MGHLVSFTLGLSDSQDCSQNYTDLISMHCECVLRCHVSPINIYSYYTSIKNKTRPRPPCHRSSGGSRHPGHPYLYGEGGATPLQICDGEMGKTDNGAVCAAEPGRTGDITGHNSNEDQADANGLHCHLSHGDIQIHAATKACLGLRYYYSRGLY